MALVNALAQNRQLSDSLAENAKMLTETRQSLAEATAESATYKTQLTQMKLRMEALGVNAASDDNKVLEQRLLAAINSLRTAISDKSKFSQALVRLVDASSLYVKTATAGSPEARLALESEIRNSNLALKAQTGEANSDTDVKGAKASYAGGRVVGVKDDLSLIVINVGINSGVRLGMPLQIMRDEQVIGSVRVVDVREKVVGAVIQNLSSEKQRIKVGDRLKVVADQ